MEAAKQNALKEGGNQGLKEKLKKKKKEEEEAERKKDVIHFIS